MKLVPVDNIVSFCGDTKDGPRIPEEVCERLKAFLLAKHSGNVVLNIKSGVVLSYHIDEYCAIRGTPD